ncbi:MAG: DNA gyrase subunit A [Bacilli bacterium]|nr:DNA gyrase subunit A [Bacilli bacterium]
MAENFDSDILESKIEHHDISKIVRKSFLEYSMSVIVSRALPDVRDGLKPVHRRIIYAMNDLGVTSDKPHKKSARIVGEVIGKYHPHGDSAVYEAMVRLAQDFSLRYPLVDGHGNFGSIDGDSAAAMRYTEARLSKMANEMTRDIGKNTVDFIPNYDGEEQEPTVLPARIPNLLVNGCSGIAVGMATNIPPHNMKEVCDALLAVADNKDISVIDLMNNYLYGPDFPTGAIILGKSGIKKAYETGSGTIVIRSKCEIEEMEHGKKRIVVSEIPYQVNKTTMIEKIADLVKNKVIEGITDLRDESNREGIRVVIELRKDVIPEVILNQLFKYSQLQITYAINMLALVNGEPKVLPLKDILNHYLDHQVEVVRRKTQYDLEKTKDKEHILEGLAIASRNIDEIIKTIRASKNDEEALSSLMSNYQLSERQAKAVLEMKFRRLTGMEQDKINLEIVELQKLIKEYEHILESHETLMEVVKNDLIEIKNKYNDERRTSFSNDTSIIEDEELIPEEEVVITLTQNGYIKRVALDTYKSQNRGGKGIKGITTHDDDVVDKLLTCSTHTDILFFTNFGKVYRLRGHKIPEYSRQGKGLPIVNLLNLEENEKVSSMIYVDNYDNSDQSLTFVTVQGIIKRVAIKEFENIRQNGKIAVTLKEDDQLLDVKLTNSNEELFIASSKGKVIRFNVDEVRQMGRSASGVKGIDTDGGVVVGCARSNKLILAITENGYGKMSDASDYRLTKRGGKGVKTINTTEKNGNLIALKAVNGDEDLLVTTTKGIIIRIPLEQVKIAGRNTMGVRIIRLDEDQFVASIAVVEHEDIIEEEEN